MHQLAEEVRSGRVSSQWVNPEDLDVIGGSLACAELYAIHSDVADAINSLQAGGCREHSFACLGSHGSPEVEARLRGHCEALIAVMPTSLSAMPDASSDSNAKSLLREATEDLIRTLVKAMSLTPGRTDRSHEPPSWCASARQDSKAKLTSESGMAETITAYCEALGRVFEVAEPRALRAPAVNLTASLPSHLQSTVADISRSVSLIRAALSSASRSQTTCPSILLGTIETELSRLIAQAEGADEMLSGSGITIQTKVAHLHVAAGKACEMAARFISCHSGAPQITVASSTPASCHADHKKSSTTHDKCFISQQSADPKAADATKRTSDQEGSQTTKANFISVHSADLKVLQTASNDACFISCSAADQRSSLTNDVTFTSPIVYHEASKTTSGSFISRCATDPKASLINGGNDQKFEQPNDARKISYVRDWHMPSGSGKMPSVKDRTAAWEAQKNLNIGSAVAVSTPMKLLPGSQSGKPLSPTRSRNSVKPFTKKPVADANKPGGKWETAEYTLVGEDTSQKYVLQDERPLAIKLDELSTEHRKPDESSIEKDEVKRPKEEPEAVKKAVKKAVEMKQAAVQVGEGDALASNCVQPKELGSAGCSSSPFLHGFSWLASATVTALATISSSVPQLHSHCSVQHAAATTSSPTGAAPRQHQPSEVS